MGQWLRLCASTEGKRSLIGELRSHMPLGKTKKIKLKNKCILEQCQKFHHLGIRGP